MPAGSPSPAFQGAQASNVALASITTLALALLTSIWESDVSGTTALLGLLAVYLTSPELLLLYVIFTPASIIVDIIRLSVFGHGHKGWLIFFSIMEMLAKCAGAFFAYGLHREVSAGGGDGVYAPVANAGVSNSAGYQRVDDPFATAYAPPRPDATPVQSSGAATGAAGYQPPASAGQV